MAVFDDPGNDTTVFPDTDSQYTVEPALVKYAADGMPMNEANNPDKQPKPPGKGSSATLPPMRPKTKGTSRPAVKPTQEDLAEITQIAEELENRTRAKPVPGASSTMGQRPASDPYFNRIQDQSTGEVKAIRPLSEPVVARFLPPQPQPTFEGSSGDSLIVEPQSEDETLNEAILTKRFPKPVAKPPTQRQDRDDSPTNRSGVSVADLESVVAHIPEAGGSDTQIRQILPQRGVIQDPGLMVADQDIPALHVRIAGGLLGQLHEVMQRRARHLLMAEGSVPFGLDYYSLQSVSKDAPIYESPSLLETAYLGRVHNDGNYIDWSRRALLNKCRQSGGKWGNTAAEGARRLPGVGTLSSIRDVALAYDALRAVLSKEEVAEILKALHGNGLDCYRQLTQKPTESNLFFYDAAPPALGLASQLLMNEERYYGDAKRWADFAEQRVTAMLQNRVSEQGHPINGDFGGLTEVMRYILPYVESVKRYSQADLLMGEGGNLSKVPAWIAHQFGLGRRGLLESGGISVDDLKRAAPLLAKLADTYRDGVAQWLLQQISIADATNRMKKETTRVTAHMRLELPASYGLDSVMSVLFYDPSLMPASPAAKLSPGARLSDSAAVMRSSWDEAGALLNLQGQKGALPDLGLVSTGVHVKFAVGHKGFAGAGGESVMGRVRDYVDMGGAAYMNGEYKGTEGSLAQRHVLFLRPEQTALVFDRFDIGDGRTLQKFRFDLTGGEKTEIVDRGTLNVPASDGSGRSARFTFFSNGFSNGVELGDAGNSNLSVEFMRGRGDLACVVNFGKKETLPQVRRLNAKEKGRVYRSSLGEGQVLFNGWPNGMPQQCGWLWTDGLLSFVDRSDDYPGRYVAIKATSVLAYDMQDGIHLGFGASDPDDPDKPVEFSVCAAGPQAVLELFSRAHVRLAFPGLKSVTVDGTQVELEGQANVFVISRALEPGRHLIEVDHESPGPESSVVRPAEKQMIGSSFAFQASIGDPIGVDSANLVIDGEYLGGTLSAAPWVWQVKTSQLSEGIHEAAIEAKDVLDHVRRSQPRLFIVDNTPPTVKLITPAKEGKRVRGVLAAEAQAEDPNGVVRVQFCLNGKSVGEPVSMQPYARDLDTRSLPDGDYQLTAVAADEAGNVGVSAPIKVTLVNHQPPPKIVALKIIPPMLQIQPLATQQIEIVAIDEEDGRHPAKVVWRQITGRGVVGATGLVTAPSAEGACVLEASLPGTDLKAKLHLLVSKEQF
ncbi:MAG: hypothetical protein IT462_12615 [Planctomycetes bacterium]|nr:hypothetical protein [Planctomycetota bacterium]